MRLASLETGHVVVSLRRCDLLHSDPVLDFRALALAHGDTENQRLVDLGGECRITWTIDDYSRELTDYSANLHTGIRL